MQLSCYYKGLKWLMCSIALLYGATSYATASLHDYFIDVWTSHEGLPHNSINAITQTEDGYLWFATWEGVARYNGKSFELFSRDPETGLIDAAVRALIPAKGNQLWVGGGRGGITLRDHYHWTQQPPAKSLVNDILLDSDSNLWLAVEGEGVFYREKEGEHTYSEDRLVLNVSAAHLAQTRSGTIYAATRSGFYRISTNGAEKLRIPHVPENVRVYYVSVDHRDHVLIGTSDGAWKFDGEQFIELLPELNTSAITVAEEDDEGNIWLGSIDKGLMRITLRGVDYIDTNSGLPNNRVISWFQDSEGSIWIGTNGGVMRLREAPFRNYSVLEGLEGNFVRTLLNIPGDRFLVGSSEGLNLLEDGKVLSASAQPAARQSTLSLANTSDNSVLVGTQRNGVYRWSSGLMTRLYNKDNGLPANEVRSLLEDSRGRTWVGTVNGLVMFEQDGTRTLFDEHASSLPDNYIIALSEDKRGRIWVGTAEGVAVYDRRNRMLTIDISEFEQAQYVFGFYIEPGFVWMATDRGLLRYNTISNELSGVGKPEGLPIDKLFQVVYDRMGSFWLTSNRGIWKISYVEAHRAASGEINSINFEHFGAEDGMGSSQVNGGSTPAAVSSKSGLLGFATAGGVSFIQPTTLKQLYQYSLPIVIEDVEVDGLSINPQRDNLLQPGSNRIRINFAGLSYIMTERLQYQTKLVGFDDEWNYQGNQTVAEYTNLPPGQYKFHVSVRYPYGEWHESSTNFEFELQPLVWQRRDVQALFIFAFAAGLSLLMYWRVYALKKRQRDMATQIHTKTEALREQSERFERLSKEDVLTGLFNRRAFDEKVRRDFMLSIQGLGRLNLAIIDIDHFKQVNDRFSHIVGDEVIKLMAKFLKKSVIAPNVVARWGGEEFTLLIHGTEEQALALCHELLEGVAQLHCPELNNEFNLTVSIGLANALGCYDYQGLLKRADHALYEAKNSGRNRLEQYHEFH
ncbi:ligand-binding sensor domain-containing diguanylate cyclase [Marinomonas atlantica]|uniref:ligand-binding sensor domain-containing diguanylate cyclase n=1 Tax=Marinomonas atlantica TaxID=1806668 RepID=UPI0008367FEF|nr:ligand-binding sensor domain-containing diguanylate cyclase [Marinomonas atlantica]MCO4786123.1 diguanylate cyclase [Marinomonas atlantica]